MPCTLPTMPSTPDPMSSIGCRALCRHRVRWRASDAVHSDDAEHSRPGGAHRGALGAHHPVRWCAPSPRGARTSGTRVRMVRAPPHRRCAHVPLGGTDHGARCAGVVRGVAPGPNRTEPPSFITPPLVCCLSHPPAFALTRPLTCELSVSDVTEGVVPAGALRAPAGGCAPARAGGAPHEEAVRAGPHRCAHHPPSCAHHGAVPGSAARHRSAPARWPGVHDIVGARTVRTMPCIVPTRCAPPERTRTGCRDVVHSPTGRCSLEWRRLPPDGHRGGLHPLLDGLHSHRVARHGGLPSPLGASAHRTPGTVESTVPAHPRRRRSRAGPHAESRPPGSCRVRERRRMGGDLGHVLAGRHPLSGWVPLPCSGPAAPWGVAAGRPRRRPGPASPESPASSGRP